MEIIVDSLCYHCTKADTCVYAKNPQPGAISIITGIIDEYKESNLIDWKPDIIGIVFKCEKFVQKVAHEGI